MVAFTWLHSIGSFHLVAPIWLDSPGCNQFVDLTLLCYLVVFTWLHSLSCIWLVEFSLLHSVCCIQGDSFHLLHFHGCNRDKLPDTVANAHGEEEIVDKFREVYSAFTAVLGLQQTW